ncbi:MAG: response regulator [Anaerolineae bacterium]|nr:response regulator [Anaerolineae bacterium]MCI0696757.1 response regulator [candidate division KSB1 bacterium]
MISLLIIEDDPNTLAGLQELLSHEGYWVRGVMRGREAFKVAKDEPIDMVLCDYCLPDIDGLQVCRELKRLNSQLVIFLVTAYRNTEVVNAAKQCGIEKIIDKPIVPEELFVMLEVAAKRLASEKLYTLPETVVASNAEAMLV